MATQTLPETSIGTTEKNSATKYVFSFGGGKADGNGKMKDDLGGKGAGLAEMTKIGLPVPAGFTISTETCEHFYKHGKRYPNELKKQVAENVAKLEKGTRKKLVLQRAGMDLQLRGWLCDRAGQKSHYQ